MRAGEPLLGTWLTLGSARGAESLAYQGFDWLGIDLAEFPASDRQTTLVEAIGSTPALPLVRSRRGDAQAVRAALSTGAAGVMISGVRTAAQADLLVSPFRGAALRERLCIIMIETQAAIEHADEILAVPGIDACFVVAGAAPAHERPPRQWRVTRSDPQPQLERILACCRHYGIAPGLHTTTAEHVAARIAEGWQLVAVGTDSELLVQAAGGMVDRVRQTVFTSHHRQHARQAHTARFAMLGTHELGGY
ncbi:MAG: aldolase/citrate lyase family protein [Chloroflexota bacterium]